MNKDNPMAVFETSLGTFKVEIFQDKMPLCSSNFIDLVENKFYNGTHIHRVIADFMIQMGCPLSKDVMEVRKGEGRAPPKSRFALPDGTKIKRDENGFIKDELTEKLSNIPGTLSMANENVPDSGSSQFFINCAYNNFLDWHSTEEEHLDSKHPVFGYVIDGWNVVNEISKVPVTVPDDYPAEPVQIKKIYMAKQS